MVFFTCSACGESLKKNQVQKHYLTRCRSCQYLTCVDCNKDFWGDDYEKHTKCITEDEKYGGKDFVQKPSFNKGEKKQTSWVEKVRNVLKSTQASPRIASLMEQLSNYENIPRKKVKFENFVRNSLNLKDPKIIHNIWELFEKAQEKDTVIEGQQSESEQLVETEKQTNGSMGKKRKQKSENTEDIEQQQSKKMKSRGNDEITEDTCNGNDEITEDTCNGNERVKFKWSKVIKNILKQHPNNMLPLKKLQKRVIKEYKTVKSDCVMEKEELKQKFHDKINKCSHLSVSDDTVTLLD